jgi:hypothetical protein
MEWEFTLVISESLSLKSGDFGTFFFNLHMSYTGFCFGHQVVMKIR